MYKPEHEYKVIRTWYVTASSQTEAMAKSKQILHQAVRVKKLEFNRFETRGANEHGTSLPDIE